MYFSYSQVKTTPGGRYYYFYYSFLKDKETGIESLSDMLKVSEFISGKTGIHI